MWQSRPEEEDDEESAEVALSVQDKAAGALLAAAFASPTTAVLGKPAKSMSAGPLPPPLVSKAAAAALSSGSLSFDDELRNDLSFNRPVAPTQVQVTALVLHRCHSVGLSMLFDGQHVLDLPYALCLSLLFTCVVCVQSLSAMLQQQASGGPSRPKFASSGL